MIAVTKIGMVTYKRCHNLPCFKRKESAIISLALLRAVSPEVIGAATTPISARIPPTLPNSELHISLTMGAALLLASTKPLSEFSNASKKCHGHSCPYQSNNAFCNHGSKEYFFTVFFIRNTPGHKRRLR